jgi:hypothetical protein
MTFFTLVEVPSTYVGYYTETTEIYLPRDIWEPKWGLASTCENCYLQTPGTSSTRTPRESAEATQPSPSALGRTCGTLPGSSPKSFALLAECPMTGIQWAKATTKLYSSLPFLFHKCSFCLCSSCHVACTLLLEIFTNIKWHLKLTLAFTGLSRLPLLSSCPLGSVSYCYSLLHNRIEITVDLLLYGTLRFEIVCTYSVLYSLPYICPTSL